MPTGYTGKILFIDLSIGEINKEQINDETYRSFIGGEGLGVKLLMERTQPKFDALGPENILGFTTGLLTACGVPAAPRSMVVTKSPLTGTLGDANAGGFFGPELKAAGYDAVFFKGISKKPVYLLILDDKVQLKDASHLWGKDTVETGQLIRRETGNKKTRVASIGPAGESVSLISAIMMDDRAAARSGVGAVMGSKRLKAIGVQGTGKVPVTDATAIKKLRYEFTKAIKGTDYFVVKTMREHGSCGFTSLGIEMGIAPSKNWLLSGKDAFLNHSKLDGKNVTKFQTVRSGCANCPIACGGTVKVEKGPYKGVTARKPEYETIISFGSMCLNDDLLSVFKAQEICDRYGIDTISAGTAIAFAIDCFDNGIIDKNDTEIDLSWGDPKAILTLLKQMVKREGFGAILTDGVQKAVETIGGESNALAVHVKGQEIAYHDFRYEQPGRGMAYIADPTPGRHERFSGMQNLERGDAIGPYPEFQAKHVEELDYEGKGHIYAKGSKYYEVFSACGMCAYVMGVSQDLNIVDFINASCGWDMTPGELLTIGERLQTLRQAFNYREGVRPQDFKLPARLKLPPVFQGPLRGNDLVYDYEALRTAYFTAMHWDPETGEPSAERLKALNLDTVL